MRITGVRVVATTVLAALTLAMGACADDGGDADAGSGTGETGNPPAPSRRA